jgi:hypothetical protein
MYWALFGDVSSLETILSFLYEDLPLKLRWRKIAQNYQMSSETKLPISIKIVLSVKKESRSRNESGMI